MSVPGLVGWRSRLVMCALAIWSLGGGARLSAQSAEPIRLDPNEPAARLKEGKILRAFRIAGTPPKIDGLLDDSVWAETDSAEGLVQTDPDNMKPMTEVTRTRVAYDDRYIYVAIWCFDRSPDQIARGLGRRDNTPPTDNISIGFDPRHDHLTGYVFTTNPSAVQSDSSIYDDDRIDFDYDAVWEVRSGTLPDDWTVEYRIPFSQLRFNRIETPQVWGFTIRRVIRRRSETGQWTGVPRGEKGIVSRWGHLAFTQPLAPRRRVELQPYVRQSATRTPLSGTVGTSAGAGFDARVGAGSASTLSLTVNPDFGQVEQDPAILNLTVFETFFPEKRPFFLEDSRTFMPPYDPFQLFYSRRIGQPPNRYPVSPSDTVVERADTATIVGAAKLTGKSSGWTYGALTALTAPEYASVRLAASPLEPAVIDRHRLEPLTSYNVGRVQRDILHGTSNVGAIATGLVRDGDADAFTGGIDFNLRWDRNRSAVGGHWAVTHAPGVGGAATGGGGLSTLSVTRKHVSGFARYDHLGRDFRVADLGFIRTRANRSGVEAGITVEQPDPWRAFRRLSTQLGATRAWNDAGLVFTNALSSMSSLQLRNFWTFTATATHAFQVLDDLDTRGGPPIVVPSRTIGTIGVTSDTRKSWRTTVNVTGERTEAGGWTAQLAPGLTVLPWPRFQGAVNVSYTSGFDVAQWITNRDVTGDGVLDNVYGTLRRHVVDMQVRSTYAVNRDFTLQAFVQPFVAVGSYSDVRRLARPRSFEFAPVVLASDPSFNRKSLRATVVARWEYVRGSTLFVAWNLAASNLARPGAFNGWRDLADTFNGDGPQALTVKVNYWFAR